jgi:hypothetical protein
MRLQAAGVSISHMLEPSAKDLSTSVIPYSSVSQTIYFNFLSQNWIGRII